MRTEKYILLAFLTVSMTISESCGVNFQLELLDATAVAQTNNQREDEADKLVEQGIKQFNASQFNQALQSWTQSLVIYRQIGNRRGVAASLGNMGLAYHGLGDYKKAIDYHLQSLAMSKETGNRRGVAASLENLGNPYYGLGDYKKAIDYHLQSLVIEKEIGNSRGVAASLGNLGLAYHQLGDYKKAIDYHQKSLVIDKEMGNRRGVASSLGNLGLVYRNLGDYKKAIDYHLQSLVIDKEMGNRLGVAQSLANLGLAYHQLGDYKKAIDYHQKSFAIQKEIGNRRGVAASLVNLGIAYYRLGDYKKAIDYHLQTLAISKEMGYRFGVSTSLGNLGNAHYRLGDYKKAIDYHQQSLAIKKEMGNRLGVAQSLGNLGNAYSRLGDYKKAIDYHQQSLAIKKEMEYRQGIANSLGNLGNAYRNLGDCKKAIDYHQQTLAISKEIGYRQGIASSLGNLGIAYYSLGDYKNAIDYHQQHLAISKEMGNRLSMANSLGSLGNACHQLGDYKKAIDYHQQYLAISKEIGNRFGVAASLNNLGLTLQKLGQLAEAEKHLRQAIDTYEDIRQLLLTKDIWKVSIFEQQAKTYRILQQVLVARQQPQQALEISQQGRTRALVEILFRHKHQKPQEELIPSTLTLSQIQQVASKQQATLVEYSLVFDNQLYIWVIPPQGKIQFRCVSLPKDISLQKLVKNTREQQLHIRGRNSNNPPSTKDNSTNHLNQLHQLLIEPIADLLPKDEQQEVIFIPYQELFLVPFVALQDEKNKYLIEKHTILTAPSIQALSLNQQDKPTTSVLPRGKDVLIVGNPTMPKTKVGKDKEPLTQLAGAEEEAQKIATMLETEAMIGGQATQSAIVEKMPSAKLIHFATHGLLDGINAIGSPGAITFTPDEKNDGFLTTSEIMENFGLSEEQKLQADLVVLSAGDTGRGDIRGEGVIGLSQAFMASGVPTLVMSLWKVPDDANVKLMTEFYTNIYERKLNKAQGMRQAMLTMLNDKDGNPDPDPTNWAAFTVIGKTR